MPISAKLVEIFNLIDKAEETLEQIKENLLVSEYKRSFQEGYEGHGKLLEELKTVWMNNLEIFRQDLERELAELKHPGVQRIEAKVAKIGDYVLATKWDDGDPCDHFFVGFLDSIDFKKHGTKGSTRYMVVDGDGYLARAGGFRRAEPITEEEGRELLKLFPTIANMPGKSLWRILDEIRSTPRADESH